MYEQLDIFSYMDNMNDRRREPEYPRLNVGDKIGRVILGEVEIGTITKVEGNEKYWFYRTNLGCFDASDRTDFDQMYKEAEKIRNQYQTIEIGDFDKFLAIKYPPRECDGHTLYAMVGIYKGMLFWKEDITYQFLQKPKNIEKAYKDKAFKITHNWKGEEIEYEILEKPLQIKRLYYSENSKLYSEARYVLYNP